MRGVPSFFNKFPSLSRGIFLPGLGPRFLPVVAFFVDGVLFFDPTGRPRFFVVFVFVTVFDAVDLALFVDPFGRPRFLGPSFAVVFIGFGLAAGLGFGFV